jgi:membrane protein required for colicin V production
MYIAHMFIDVLALLAIAAALYKGYNKGLIMALFSTVSLIIGLAAAVKFSSYISPLIAEKFEISGHLAPIISFILVYLGVMIIIRAIGKGLQKTLESIQVGFLNRVGGMALYLVLYLSIASIIIYYLEKMGVLGEDLIRQSYTYTWLAPWGPAVLDGIGYLIPLFKDMFGDLNGFFDDMSPGEHG